MIGNFICPFDGEEFDSREELDEHIDQLHSQYQEDKESFTITEQSLLSSGNVKKLEDLTQVNSIQVTFKAQNLSFLQTDRSLNTHKLVGLKSFNISQNQLQSLDFIKSFTSLKILDISNNSISDILPLVKLTNLQSLNASYNKINDLSALKLCKQLISINMKNNELVNFDLTLMTLKNLPRLSSLVLLNNPCVKKTPEYQKKISENLRLEELDGHSFNRVGEEDFTDDADQATPARALSFQAQGVSQVVGDPATARQIRELKKENVEIRGEINKVWQLISAVVKNDSIQLREALGGGAIMEEEYEEDDDF